jgi:hypothetical protein
LLDGGQAGCYDPRRMPILKRAAIVFCAVGVAASCSVFKSVTRPSKESVQAALQTEAEGMKRDGEKPMPGMGVKSLWTIEGIDIQEQKDDNRPWRGTVRFRIDTAMREPDGTISKDSIKKTFNYVYDAPMKKWLVDYK